MSFWTDLKVKAKIMTLVMASCIGLILVGAFGTVNMSRMNGDEAILKDGMQQTALLQDLKNHFLAMRLDLVYMLSLKDGAKLDEKSKDFASQVEEVRAKLGTYENLNINAKEKEGIKAFRQGFEAYAVDGAKLADMSKTAHVSASGSAMDAAVDFATSKVAPLYLKPAQTIADMVAANVKDSEDIYRRSSDSFQHIRLAMLAVIVFVALMALLLGTFIANSVSRPIQAVLGTLREVAGGNLTVRSAITSRDEMGQLAREVNATAGKLNEIISMVASNSEHVASAAAELHATAAEMATGAEQMAAQAGTVATASEEMSATTGDIAQNCHTAASEALQASQTAEIGASVVENTVQVMGRIANRVKSTAKTVESLGGRSDQIGAIVGTIEDIADQTNLLALNAAIEAARAGEQGRGFAVVADEVRALAERTTKATKEISDMIKAIQNETRGAVVAMEEGVMEVESGTAEAAKSGTALQAILEQINSVNMQVSQIATAAEEQTATTAEISSNIQQINDVVQHTANGAHESVVAANQLSRLAEELQRLVGQFRL
jgi:methyl-accepting chemotaxis protein